MKEVETFSDAIKQYFSEKHLALLIPLVVYAAGFVIWNYHLSQFGFFEYNLVQVRFISAGILFFLFPFLFFFAGIYNKKIKEYSCIQGSIMLLIVVWFWFVPTHFYEISQVVGGGKPIPTALIGTIDQMKYVENFNVELAPNSNGKDSVQTSIHNPICLIYENDKYAIFAIQTESVENVTETTATLLVKGRVITLSKQNFLGFHRVTDKEASARCLFIVKMSKPL